MSLHIPKLIPDSIRGQLRLVLTTILFVVFCSMITVVSYTFLLNKSARGLTDIAIPGFSQSIALQKSLMKIDKELFLIDSAETIEAVDHSGAQLSLRMDELAHLTKEIFRHEISYATSETFENAKEKVEKLSESVALFVNNKRKILQTSVAIVQAGDELDILFENLADILNDLSSKTRKQLYQDLSYNVRDQSEIHEGMKQLAQHDIILEITHDISYILDKIHTINRLNKIETFLEVKENLSFYFSKIAIKITNLAPGENRNMLSSEFIAMRRALTERTGLLENVTQYYHLLDDRIALQEQQSEILYDLSTLANNTAILARDQVQEASVNVKNSIAKIALTIILSAILAVILIALTNIFIIEGRVHQRLTALTHAVRDLAKGNTDIEISVTGQDEFTDMASALRIFKSNAIELQRSNTELENFAYAAAHDLRSPLRAIRNLAEWIVEDEENTFTEESQEYMDLLMARLMRLDKLLTDLLQYARAGREDSSVEEVSISETVSEFSDILDGFHNFNITYSGTCDMITTHVTPFRQILLNLISNAIKHHDKTEGNIKITAYSTDEKVHVTVQDDGAGIEEKHQKRIFELFKTLKSRDDVEGSGLGLSMVKKLVEYYGGAIEVSSNPSVKRGASFSFTLPLKKKADA